MVTYWLMFFIPVAFLFSADRLSVGVNRLYWFVVISLLSLIIGLRYEVGGDWGYYFSKFYEARNLPFFESVQWHKDPAYWFFNWLFANLGLGVWAQNLFCAMLSVGGVVAIARRQPLPWLAMVIAIPYILMVVSMGYVRQAAALGLVCLAYNAVQDKNQIRFLIFAVAAAMFHKSAVVILPLYLLTLQRIRIYHWFLLSIVSAAILGVLVLETLEAQWQSYVENQKESSGALIRIAMNLPPAILLLIWTERLGMSKPELRHWLWFARISILLIFMVSFAETAVDRLALYLLPLQMVVLSRIHRIFTHPVPRSALAVAVLAYYFLVMFVWLNFAKHADSWLPYQFYPFVN